MYRRLPGLEKIKKAAFDLKRMLLFSFCDHLGTKVLSAQ
jgi:hypothetical protein